MSSYLVRVVERTENLRLVFQLCHSFVFVLSFMLYHFVQGKIWDEGVLVASTILTGGYKVDLALLWLNEN